eukprot:CAMPEP_0202960512 /NCGR_PEP_ID=MMETSP1396-20130829/4653_1 /ASSEMBLY_ACC=CAM_ASM_000872 /TAXON_ID= /ORGANISM="Pseudokeronopsis sp., Strain Brazil" /LENGTH=119 /DNA_ID=CAMNT_0049679769 /DNA_START=844 /DNA_END=1203 /DNA_ORIENTATION=-
MENFKQPLQKWMNIAWDAFRIADNHNKSMIFQLPEDPRQDEYDQYLKVVKRPISLENIRNKLNMRLYQDLDSFVDDMETLFDNWVKFRGKEHKMYKYCEAVQQRFEKFLYKHRDRASDP